MAEARVAKSRERQKALLAKIADGYYIKVACTELGIPYRTYEVWRQRYPAFRARVEEAKVNGRHHLGILGGPTPTHTGDKTFDFAMERAHFFGHDSPAFQLEMVHAFENLAPGNILMVLLPPDHGKTTLYEDWATLRLAHSPFLRHHIGSESVTLSRKILGRVASRLDNTMADPRMSELITKYGPFSPPRDAERRRGQPWTSTHFDVFRKAEFDERDYSMAALGFGSQIIGSRSDHLHVDDVQSMKTLGQTESMVDTFSQDWLSRPGREGITTIVGNRVDEGDFYQALMERLPPDILQVIKYPAIVERDGKAEPLWPGRWSLETLDKERRKLGNDAIWERNWMQRPRARSMRTFDEATVDRCLHPLRKLGDIVPGASHVIGIDPAVGERMTKGAGRNAMVTCQFDETGITPVLIRQDQNLVNNQQILAVLEDAICTVQAGKGYVTDVVIEENAFQKGLANDVQLLDMRDRYGFAIRPHQTGMNKYDENIGVPSMAHTMLTDKVHIPWAADDYTRLWCGELRAQFLAWRPLKRGSQLRQDILMALWFVWVLWRQRRGAVPNRSQAWQTGAKLAYKPTSGLVLGRAS